MEDEGQPETQEERRFRKRFALYFLLAILSISALVVWIQRTSLADGFVRSELDKRDVEAQYQVEEIGIERQVLTDLVLGDPTAPDLTADRVEVGIGLAGLSPSVRWVRAEGVKLRATLRDGQLSLGALDKFSDPDDDSPFALPDIWLAVQDGRVRLDSDFGMVGLSINGEGQLQNGWQGEVAAISRELSVAHCTLSDATFYGEVDISGRQPRFRGPLRLPGFRCKDSDASGEDLAAQVDMRLGEDFASWDGSIGLVGGPVRFAANRAQEIRTRIEVAGDIGESAGEIDLMLSGIGTEYGRADQLRFAGPFSAGADDTGVRFALEGQPKLRNAAVAPSLVAGLDGLADAFADSPVGPVAAKLATAVRLASGSLGGRGNLDLRYDNGQMALRVGDMSLRARSGAEVRLDNELVIRTGNGPLAFEGDPVVRVAGGGLPRAIMTLDGSSLTRGFSGRLQMADYSAGTARLAVPELTFTAVGAGSTALRGRINLSGPLPDGRLVGLQAPLVGRVSANGSYSFYPQCIEAQFASANLSAFSAGQTRMRLCPQGGAMLASSPTGARFNLVAPSPVISGRLGGTPLGIAADRVSYSLTNGMVADNMAVRLGTGESQTRLDMAVLRAAFGDTITGSVSGGSGQIANVPLLMENIEGDWRFANGEFAAAPQMTILDAEQVDRFLPLVTQNGNLRFAGNDITATGTLVEPVSGREVADVDILHRLNSSSGRALLDVQNLLFDDDLQPEQLTPLTLGVIANVYGLVSGQGVIEWNADGVDSRGTFRTDGLDLAAAFGPVRGLAGEIMFTDLLGFETAPGQTVSLESVNPGVEVLEGLVTYRILPDFRVAVDGGTWPFAGGELRMAPAVFDLTSDAERKLTFEVVGVDAAEFLKIFEFDNLSATGTFDGELPMIFDEDGGRIVGGRLAARPGGGTIAYVGELTYEDLSTFANFAFEMLRSLKYRELQIGMNGDLDGEIVTNINFSGLQQGDDIRRNFITRELAKIPIEFNVRIEAPFMQLLSSVRGYYDPSLLIGQNLPVLLDAQRAAQQTENSAESGVQRPESEDVP